MMTVQQSRQERVERQQELLVSFKSGSSFTGFFTRIARDWGFFTGPCNDSINQQIQDGLKKRLYVEVNVKGPASTVAFVGCVLGGAKVGEEVAIKIAGATGVSGVSQQTMVTTGKVVGAVAGGCGYWHVMRSSKTYVESNHASLESAFWEYIDEQYSTDEVLRHCICPINNCIIREAAQAPSGHYYEHKALKTLSHEGSSVIADPMRNPSFDLKVVVTNERADIAIRKRVFLLLKQAEADSPADQHLEVLLDFVRNEINIRYPKERNRTHSGLDKVRMPTTKQREAQEADELRFKKLCGGFLWDTGGVDWDLVRQTFLERRNLNNRQEQ